MIRQNCAGCDTPSPTSFLDLGKTPLANHFPASAIEPEDWYPLRLGVCERCGLTQQMEIIPDETIYGQEYGFYSGASTAQRTYHRRAAHVLLERHPDECRGLIVEIGCNDGSMLTHFAQDGRRAVGVDPSRPADLAVDAGMTVYREPFGEELAYTIRADHGPARLIVAYNVLAHVNDLRGVLTGIGRLLARDGLAVIELQYLPDLLVGNMFDQVYHEHRYHWSLHSFAGVAANLGLNVVDAELIELQGGGIRITVSSTWGLHSARAATILDSERWLMMPDGMSAFASMQGRVERARRHLLDLIDAERRDGRYVYGFAAAAKATTILNFCGLGPDVIPVVVDSTPYKRGRFIPGVKIPIIRERDYGSEADSSRLLLAPNYLPWLLRDAQAFLDEGGRWIVPTPVPMVI